jgi:tetratricopeptide (TPR) repeat protein
MGELTINSTPAGCTVLLDGRPFGTTDGNGVLKKPAPLGAHSFVFKKPDYYEQQLTITILAGNNEPIPVALNAMPGHLTITTPGSDAHISIQNIGDYTGSIEDKNVAPGVYEVTVSRLGYHAATRRVEIKPNAPTRLDVPLEQASADELLTQAKEQYDRGSYPQAAQLARMLLTTKPEDAKANMLLGASLFSSGSYDESIAPLTKAISQGESFAVPIRHKHGNSWSGKSVCTGRLTLHRSEFEFVSKEYPDEGFRVSYAKVYELALKDNLRLNMKVGVPKPGSNKEEKREFNFYTPDAVATGMIVTCGQCQQQLQALLQVIQQFRSQH